jgi:hypothetical protein
VAKNRTPDRTTGRAPHLQARQSCPRRQSVEATYAL